MAIKYNEFGEPTEIVNGVKITETSEGLLIGEGASAILIRGKNLRISDKFTKVSGVFPNFYPFVEAKPLSEKEVLDRLLTDPEFPQDGCAMNTLTTAVRILKRMVLALRENK